jgi:succinylglutamate desuccinylase
MEEPWCRHLSKHDRIACVAICGGTHGDERNGVYLGRNYAKIQGPAGGVHGYNFELQVVESNPEAVKKNLRYIEEDLNRCFLSKDLENPEHTTLYEHRRAKEINALLGPKTSPTPAADYVLDLHNTTAATGVALFLHPRDTFSQGLAAYLKSIDSTVQVALWANRDVMLLPSLGRSGMTVEVGPVSIKCLHAGLYKQTQTLLDAALRYMTAHNVARKRTNDGNNQERKQERLQCVQMIRAVPFPRGPNGDLSGMIHPAVDGKDFSPLNVSDPAFSMFDGSAASVKDIVGSGDELPEVVFPFLVNEASYYEKDTAFLIGKLVEFTVDVLVV